MTSPETSGSAATRALALLPAPLRRHLETAVLPLCGWDPAADVPEIGNELGGRRLAFGRATLCRGGSARVMIEQLAALEGFGAESDVYAFEPGRDPAVEAEIRARCPSVRRIRRVARRLAAWNTLALAAALRRHDLFVSSDIHDPLIFAATVRRLRIMRPPRVAVVMHEAYDRYLEFLRPHAPRIAAFCLDYDFTARLRAVYGPAIPAGIVAPLFPFAGEKAAGGGDLRRALGIPEDAQVLAYAGRLDRNKRIGLLADLLDDLLAEGRDRVWLLLAGRWEDDAYRREIEARFGREAVSPAGRRLRLSDRLRVAVSPPALGPVFSAADVFVFGSAIEGFYPLVVMEAQHAGLPVVCTGVGGLGRTILDGVTGCLVPTEPGSAEAGLRPDTRPAFADRVRLLLDGPEARARIGAAGRDVVDFLTAHYPFGRRFRRWLADTALPAAT